MKYVKRVEKILSFLTLLISIYLIFQLFKPLADEYLNYPRSVGGDYYNALVYAVHFDKHLPFPPSGWLPFWHQGRPVIGGYPILPFYLMTPLFNYFEVAKAMEVFAITSHLVFLLASLLLFFLITRSGTFSLILTYILFITRATYYQLFAEGLVVASISQWLLPVNLITLYLYFKSKQSFSASKKDGLLVLTSLVTGLAILFHPVMGLLTILIPTTVLLIFYLWDQEITLKMRLQLISRYIIISSLVGSTNIYFTLSQMFYSGGSGACNNPQCWGVYPQHFQLWFSNYLPILFGLTALFWIISQLIKKKASFKPIIPPIVAFLTLSLYLVAAYLHRIDTISSAISPRRIFWALNLLILLIIASFYSQATNSLGKKTSWLPSLVSLLIIITYSTLNPQALRFNTTSIFNYPNTIPSDISEIIPKRSDSIQKNLNTSLPNWIIQKVQNEDNFRFDTLNLQVVHWWNNVFKMPSTRGYSNSPVGENIDWQYFLQVGTSEHAPDEDPELIKNQSLFLIDHFAISLYDDSGRASSQGTLGYNKKLILDDPKIITKSKKVRELDFYEISKDFVTPIIYPTKSPTILVLGSDEDYQTFVRALSLTGLTSKTLIPVKGPESIDQVTHNELENFDALVLYGFKGRNFNRIEEFVKGGKFIFIDSANSKSSNNNLSNLFPIKSYQLIPKKGDLRLKTQEKTPLTENVNVDDFSPFEFEGGPWKVASANQSEVRSSAQTILKYEDKAVFVQKDLGKGKIIWSGLNLPYHIIKNKNLQEVRLLKNIFRSIQSQNKSIVESKVTRNSSEKILIEGKNFEGIYFKENYDSGWGAKINDKEAKVYKAGLGFMYIPLDKINNDSLRATLEYKGSFTNWFLFILTLATLTFSFLYILFPGIFKRIFRLLLYKLRGPLGFLHRKWDEE